MKSTANIIHTIRTLKYFSSNLQIDKEKIDKITEGAVNQQKRFLKELMIVNKYLAVHCYNFLNENTLVMPQEFRFLITKSKDEFVEFKSINKKFPAMSDQEFDQYLDIYKELQSEVK